LPVAGDLEELGELLRRVALGEDAPEEMGPPLPLWQRLNPSAERFEVGQRLVMRATRGQRVKALRNNVGMPAFIRGNRKLVPGLSERPGKWKERPEVTVERRGAEKDPDRAIIAHGKNRSARIVYVSDGDL
jgi:hypothetical protein